MFNSVPTFPRIDFGCGCLLSFCFYCLLETPRLLTTPRQYGNGLSVLAQSEIRHLTYATSCRTSSLIISGRRLDYIARVQLEFGEKSRSFRLTLPENRLGFGENSLITSGAAGII
jgi:hypothetical protein